MILFTSLVIMLIALGIILFIGGIGSLFVFGDLLVCLLIIRFIVNLVLKRRRTR